MSVQFAAQFDFDNNPRVQISNRSHISILHRVGQRIVFLSELLSLFLLFSFIILHLPYISAFHPRLNNNGIAQMKERRVGGGVQDWSKIFADSLTSHRFSPFVAIHSYFRISDISHPQYLVSSSSSSHFLSFLYFRQFNCCANIYLAGINSQNAESRNVSM